MDTIIFLLYGIPYMYMVCFNQYFKDHSRKKTNQCINMKANIQMKEHFSGTDDKLSIPNIQYGKTRIRTNKKIL